MLSGIVNGIDTAVWDPATDPHLAATYTATTLPRRAANKRAIEEAFGLEPGDGFLFCVVSRLGWQKGMDILGECIDGLVGLGARLAVLGSGEAAIEGMFRAAAARHPGKVGILTGYHEPLSHLLQGGSDSVLVPSRFEPCGLTQFYGLRYGCVPLVSRVGGLADTVIDANLAALDRGVATGIQFLPVEAPALERALARAVELHRDAEDLAQAPAERHEVGAVVGRERPALRRPLPLAGRLSHARADLRRRGDRRRDRVLPQPPRRRGGRHRARRNRQRRFGKSGGFLALDWCDGSRLSALARRSFALHAELGRGCLRRRLPTSHHFWRLQRSGRAAGSGRLDLRPHRPSTAGSARRRRRPRSIPAAFTKASCARRKAMAPAPARHGDRRSSRPGDRVTGVMVDGEPVKATRW